MKCEYHGCESPYSKPRVIVNEGNFNIELCDDCFGIIRMANKVHIYDLELEPNRKTRSQYATQE